MRAVLTFRESEVKCNLWTIDRIVLVNEICLMRIGDIIAALVWIIFLAGAVSSGLKMGHANVTHLSGTGVPFPPPKAAIFLVIFFFVTCSTVPFLLRRRQFQTWTGRLIDRIFGQGTCATVVARLKPIGLMASWACTVGFVGFASTHAGSQSWTAYVNSAVALSMGLGLAVAYALSRRFPPPIL